MERKADKRLEELRNKGTPIYSISRLDCINRCLYEAYLTYVLGSQQFPNVYSILGGRIHTILEGITNGTNTQEDLLPAMQGEFEEMDMLGIEFPKSRDGGDAIRQNWIANMESFCKEYKPPKGKQLKAEELFIYQTPKGRYLQGYIDLQQIHDDGSISIFDYKTSSLYKGSDIKEHARQLITYALGKEQEGIKVRNASWIFLKYVSVRFVGKKTAKSKKETEIIKVIERRHIAHELAPYIEGTLNKLGYDEFDIDLMLSEMRQSNSLAKLPEEAKSQYKITPYILSVDLSDEARQECIDYIDSTIDRWEALSEESEYTPREFVKIQQNGKQVPDYFFCCNLCGHFRNCKYIHEYLDSLVGDEINDLF